MEEPSTSKELFEDSRSSHESFIENFADADFISSSSDEDFEKDIKKQSKIKTMASAEHYMVEYSGLTPSEIAKILESKTPKYKYNIEKRKRKFTTDFRAIDTNGKNNTVQEIDKERNIKTIEENKVTSEQRRNSLGTVEDMSSSSEDSSDLIEVDSSVANVRISPNETFDDKNDLFSDIFGLNTEDKNPKIQVIVDPKSQFDQKDDLFNDIFGSCNSNTLNIEEKAKEIQIDLLSDMLNSKEAKNRQNTSSDLESSQHTLDTFKTSNQSTDVGKIISSTSVTQEDVNINFEQNSSKLKTREELSPALDLGQEAYVNVKSINIHDQTNTNDKPSKISLPDDSVELINNLQKANRTTGSLNKQLTELKNKLKQETSDLLNEKGAKQRMAEHITDQMYQEAQDLLELFGVPYIIAPMEAEAQCAFLDKHELTNGTITDDSDIWLFGGRTVYKNFFNQNKYVMEFRAENIEHHFKLSREQMILLALLVGSDYTNGLQGVGPVTALEILSTFPPTNFKETDLRRLVSGLKEFRSWFTKGKSPGIGRTTLKKKLKNITFTDNFPSIQVVQAYLDPKVETSDELFSWGKPNFDALIEFAKEKFGWTTSKAEQIVNPVLKRMQESRAQKSIKDYFTIKFKVTDSGKVQEQMSKRVKSAVTNMGKDPDQRLADEFTQEVTRELKKKPTKRKTDFENENKEVKSNRSRQKKHEESKKINVLSATQESGQNNVDIDNIEPSSDVKVTKNKKNIKRKVIQTVTDSRNKEGDLKKSRKNSTDTETKTDPETCCNIQTLAVSEIDDDDVNKKTKSKVKKQTKKFNARPNSAKTEEKSQIIVLEKTSTSLEQLDEGSKNESMDSEDNITSKIALIRQRRENKKNKTQLDAQNVKIDKLKTKEKKKEVVHVPDELKGDEDIEVFVQTALISGSKVEEIYKQAQEDLDNLQASTSKSCPSSALKLSKPNIKQSSTTLKLSVPRGIPGIPRKDVIPQKKQDQATILRNKMKAIEVFRKGKKGPGYVPKRGKQRRLPKDDAELSENSD